MRANILKIFILFVLLGKTEGLEDEWEPKAQG